MARVAPRLSALDERGAVYVEFLIVFFPVFILFLGICQIALVGAGRFVVQHAANCAARSAVVMLEDDFADAERGRVSLHGFANVAGPPQQGARMAPIRFAAYVPLAVLAPPLAWLGPQGQEGSLGDALGVGMQDRLASSLLYNHAGAVVTLQAGPSLDELASEPIGRKSPVTVRVTYLYYCSIPVVRVWGCKSLTDLTGEKPGTRHGPFGQSTDARTPAQKRLASILACAEDQNLLARLDASGARFAVLTAETTLPNQGAAYY